LINIPVGQGILNKMPANSNDMPSVTARWNNPLPGLHPGDSHLYTFFPIHYKCTQYFWM